MARIRTRKNLKHDRPKIIEGLMEMARSGAPRPKQLYSIEGRFLSQLTCETHPDYDLEFDQAVRNLRPDWFRKPKNSSAALKAEIRAAAHSGAARPSGRVGNALSHYLNENCGSYDAELRRELHALRPDWFPARRMEVKKQKFLELAQSGASKPNSSSLTSYCQPGNACYDPEFSDRVRKLRPDWFSITEAAKLEVLKFAKSGGARPSEKNSGRTIYHAFRRYTRPEERYDPEFTALLKATRPDWFEKPKRVYESTAKWRLV